MSGHSKWANIKHKKGKADALRGAVTTKIGREITIAVRIGGSDPAGNMRLKLALQKAKANNVPKDNIQRAIQKGLGSQEGASNYEEIMYEGYGPGGVAVLIEIMTDNRNRTAADVRHLFSKYGGNLGESGCVSWMFKKKGVFEVDKGSGIDEDELMMMALDAGAEDVKSEGDCFEVITAPEDYTAVEKALEDNKVIVTNSEVAMLPDTMMVLSQEDADRMMKLLDALEEHDDVQEVYTNFDIPDEFMDDL